MGINMNNFGGINNQFQAIPTRNLRIHLTNWLPCGGIFFCEHKLRLLSCVLHGVVMTNEIQLIPTKQKLEVIKLIMLHLNIQHRSDRQL